MKKYIVVLSLLLLMTACSNTNVKLENPKKLFSIGTKTYTQDDILNQILAVDYGQFLIQKLEDDVVETIVSEVDFDVETQIQEEMENFKKYADSLNMELKQLINLYGFNDTPSFKMQLRRSAVMDLFVKEAIENDLEGNIKKYGIKPLKAYTVDSEETAKQMIRYVESNYEMENFETEFSLKKAEAVFYYDGLEGLSEELKISLENIEESKITYEAVSKDQYVVYLYNDKTYDEDALTQFILNKTDFPKDLMVEKIKEGNLTIYNKLLKENMKEDFSEYIK